MGMHNGALNDDQITASSHYSHHYAPHKGRLYHDSCWMPRVSDPNQYLEVSSQNWTMIARHFFTEFLPKYLLQFDFLEPRIISGISTQGREGTPYSVSSYSVMYKTDNMTWTSMRHKSGNPMVSFNQSAFDLLCLTIIIGASSKYRSSMETLIPKLWSQTTLKGQLQLRDYVSSL